jgi:hypothetical protein
MYKAISLSLKLLANALVETDHTIDNGLLLQDEYLNISFVIDKLDSSHANLIRTNIGIHSDFLDPKQLVSWILETKRLTMNELIEMPESEIQKEINEIEQQLRDILTSSLPNFLSSEDVDNSKLMDWCLKYAQDKVEPLLVGAMNKLSETSLSLPSGHCYPDMVLLFTPIYEDDGLCYLRLTKETCENIVNQFGIFTLFLSLADVATSPNHFGQLIVNEVLTSALAQLIK